MAHRINNYSAFYVSEPFSETNLGAYSAKDFVYYNMLRAWKGKDCSFPFLDAGPLFFLPVVFLELCYLQENFSENTQTLLMKK